MAGIIDLIRQEITPDTINQISSEIGEDPAKTRQAIDASVPLLAGAISTQVPDAAQASGDPAAQPSMFGGGLGDVISGAGGAGGAGGLGGVLGGMLGGGAAGGMLDSILGGSHSSVQNDVSKASGIEPQKIMRILTMLAPIVFAAYTKHRQGGGSPGTATQGDGGILGDILGRI